MFESKCVVEVRISGLGLKVRMVGFRGSWVWDLGFRARGVKG